LGVVQGVGFWVHPEWVHVKHFQPKWVGRARRVSRLGFQVSGFGRQVCGVDFQAEGVRCRMQRIWCRVGDAGCRV
jgi:hypothetical protein